MIISKKWDSCMIIGYSGKIQGLFRPISVVSVTGRYDPIRPIRTDSAWISSIHRESARFIANQPESKPRQRKSWKKKKENTWQDAARHVGSGFPRASPHRTQVRLLWCCVRASQIINIRGPFGNVVLVTLFVFFENKCGWKSMWKYM